MKPDNKHTEHTKRQTPVILTRTEQHALIDAIDAKRPSGLRNKAIIHLMLDAGLKVSELTSLKWADFDLATGRLRVRYNGNGTGRTLMVREATTDIVAEWYIEQQERTPDADTAFTTIGGNALSPRYLQATIKRCANIAGIEKTVTPYTLRHSFAVDLCRATKSLAITQLALGHTDIATTAIYADEPDPDFEAAMLNFRANDVPGSGGNGSKQL